MSSGLFSSILAGGTEASWSARRAAGVLVEPFLPGRLRVAREQVGRRHAVELRKTVGPLAGQHDVRRLLHHQPGEGNRVQEPPHVTDRAALRRRAHDGGVEGDLAGPVRITAEADALDVWVGLAGAAGVLDGVEARRRGAGQVGPAGRVGALAEGPGAQKDGFRHDLGGSGERLGLASCKSRLQCPLSRPTFGRCPARGGSCRSPAKIIAPRSRFRCGPVARGWTGRRRAVRPRSRLRNCSLRGWRRPTARPPSAADAAPTR